VLDKVGHYNSQPGIWKLKEKENRGVRVIPGHHLDHLLNHLHLQLGIESYQSQLNLTRPLWNVNSLERVADFTVIESPLATVFRDKYNVPMVLRFNEIHKFSDGTLRMVEEALDFRVKECHVYDHGTRRYTNHWTANDLTRNKRFLAGICKRLKLRRIFRSLDRPRFLQNHVMNVPISPVWESRESSEGGTKLVVMALIQLLSLVGKSEEGIVQSGSGDCGWLSSGFHHVSLFALVKRTCGGSLESLLVNDFHHCLPGM
jgi:hypothetical protein